MLTQGKFARFRMRLLTCFCLSLASVTLYADEPALFVSSQFNAAMIAEAVNYYVLIGEDRAKVELEALSPLETYSPISYTHALTNVEVAERISWVCKILWQGKSQLPPGYGGLWDVEGRFGDSRLWPLYPVVQSGSSYFVLSTSYVIAGVAERPRDYLRRCEGRGPFRTEPVHVPSRSQAERELRQLRNSSEWMSAWAGLRPGEKSNTESSVWNFLWNQAEGISDRGAVLGHH